jgi:predicted membrane protein
MENRRDFRDKPHHSYSGTSKIAIGVVLVLVGFLLVIRNTGFLPDYFQDIIFSWQMLLIAIGFVMTLGSGHKGPGLIVMAVGAFFILPEVFNFEFRTYRLFWPAILIIIGIIVLTNSQWLNRKKWVSKSTGSDDVIDIVSVFGGGERRIISQNFQGGKVSCVFGGNELDLTRAQLAPGENQLEIACVFGGVSLIVPPDWHVIMDITPVLGGFSDQRKFVSEHGIDTSKTLVIRGAVVFGGGELKSY